MLILFVFEPIHFICVKVVLKIIGLFDTAWQLRWDFCVFRHQFTNIIHHIIFEFNDDFRIVIFENVTKVY